MRIDTNRIILKDAGKFPMNENVILSIAEYLRSNPDLDTEPVLVVPTGNVIMGRQVYRLNDGRHRYFGYVIANRKSLPAELDMV